VRLDTLDRIAFPNLSIRIMRGMLLEHGIDPAPALRAAGLEARIIDDPSGRVSGRQELDFQLAYATLTGPGPEIWFQTGLRYHTLTYGTYGFAMMTARTLRRALEFSALFSDLHYSLMVYAPLVDAGRVTGITMDPSAIPGNLRDFSLYRGLGAVSTMLRDIWQGPFPFLGIDVTMPAPAEPAYFARELGTQLRFGAARNAWLWSEDLQDAVLPMGSAVCEDTYERQCIEIIRRCRGEDNFVQAALAAMVRSPGFYPSPASLAVTLCVSERTLQRRLTERGLSYRVLLDQVRYQQARELLRARRMTIEQIAVALGYSEMAAFTRAFTRWFGASPSSYRRSIVDQVEESASF
jgi:AraC-like DNA-binding protein